MKKRFPPTFTHSEIMNEKLARFCQSYGIKNAEQFDMLYEIDEVVLFLPPQPTETEKEALMEVVGAQSVTYGYMDYQKSNNTFELIMQWREKTGNWD
jgi:hypothetical protein